MFVPLPVTPEVGQQHIEFILNIVMTFPCHKFNNSVRLSIISYLTLWRRNFFLNFSTSCI